MFATIFWALVTIGALGVGLTEQPLYLLAVPLTAAYTVYLFRGGRVRIFFF